METTGFFFCRSVGNDKKGNPNPNSENSRRIEAARELPKRATGRAGKVTYQSWHAPDSGGLQTQRATNANASECQKKDWDAELGSSGRDGSELHEGLPS